MRFLLNERAVDIPGADPNMTVLHYLRTRATLTGTKEGCASGDCGACTVLVSDDRGRYRAVNACITPLGALAGRHLLTVEGLGRPGRLHPVQQAMVDADASQCGFCTPGFVMALAGIYLERDASDPPDRPEVIEGIAGNLCRCTGYKPIIDAGLRMFEYGDGNGVPGPRVDPGAARSERTADGYLRPSSEAELQQILRQHAGAPIVAGGTDFMLEITQRFRRFDTLIDVTGVDSLCRIEESEAHWEIGAAVPYRDLELFFAERFPELVQLLTRFGSRQIRHRATIGGNLATASPIADIPPVLLVLEAEIFLVDASGRERCTSVPDFYRDYRQTVLEPGEYIARIRVPRPRPPQRVYLYKLSKRYEDDISSVMVAVLIGPAGAGGFDVRIAFGGMAATPLRGAAAERALRGSGLGPEAVDAAMQAIAAEFAPIDDVRASARYRLAMAQNLVRRALVEHMRGADTGVFADV